MICAVDDSQRFQQGIYIYTAYATFSDKTPDQSFNIITEGKMSRHDRGSIDDFIRGISTQHPDYELLLCRHFKRQDRLGNYENTLDDVAPLYVTRFELKHRKENQFTDEQNDIFSQADSRARQMNTTLSQRLSGALYLPHGHIEFLRGHTIYVPRSIITGHDSSKPTHGPLDRT